MSKQQSKQYNHSLTSHLFTKRAPAIHSDAESFIVLDAESYATQLSTWEEVVEFAQSQELFNLRIYAIAETINLH